MDTQFRYFGSEICKDSSSDADVVAESGRLRAFGILSSIWRNGSYPNSLKYLKAMSVQFCCRNLNKTWSDMKQLAHYRIRWRAGAGDALCPGRYQGN